MSKPSGKTCVDAWLTMKGPSWVARWPATEEKNTREKVHTITEILIPIPCPQFISFIFQYYPPLPILLMMPGSKTCRRL